MNVFRNIPYEVYSNIFNMVDYRGLKAQNTKIAENAFRAIDRHHVDAGDTLFIMLPKSEDARPKVSELIRFIERSLRDWYRATHKRVSIVVDVLVSESKIILNTLQKLNELYSDGKIYFEIITYEQLQFNWPESIAYTPHHVINDDDPNITFIRETHLKLPSIRMNDTGALWCGARPKDIVEIKRANGTIAYRVVIQALID